MTPRKKRIYCAVVLAASLSSCATTHSRPSADVKVYYLRAPADVVPGALVRKQSQEALPLKQPEPVRCFMNEDWARLLDACFAPEAPEWP